MGCCSVTQRHSGTDEVGPDEIELLQIDNTGLWSLGETRLQLSLKSESEEAARRCPAVRELTEESQTPDPVPTEIKHCDHQQAVLWGRSRDELHQRIYTEPIRSWEGQSAHAYGEIVWSSRVRLRSPFMQESSERYLVLFSFHLLILALDDLKQEFIYEGVLPLSGMSVQVISHDGSTSNVFEISGPMVDSKVVVCASPADMRKWVESIEERRHKASKQQLSPSNSALSYLVPCDEGWKREELKRYLLRAPIWQWEGTPIQHMGSIGHLSFVRITYSQRQGSQERLLVLFPQDLLFLSVDSQRAYVKYEGRLPCNSIKALERSALPGRLEFELTGDLVDPLLVSCTCPGDYENWIFRLQQPEKTESPISTQPAPPLMPKKSQKRGNAPQIPM
ncbi:rho guanine nucleotide exchange factor 6 [Megalops cyprinoides]|uniref:rho guanine nucleotide exchange factor 6 n=1 Tax=Megalops cyprinoides TaxID=118141 RepID=UPI001863DCDF|nr:rho guanine nucleotide exchange factor 6 [Megalops cyprinoides]